jgi:hypothetical protein
MEIVHVCNTDISKLMIEMQCKLAELSYSQYVESYYNIKCFDKSVYHHLRTYLLLLDNLNKNINCVLSTDIELSIEKIKDMIKNCPNCNKSIDDVSVIDLDNDWYNSQDYIDCLEWQLEHNGYIEPLIDICNSLNININHNRLCNHIALTLSQSHISCNIIPTINIESVCNISTINVQQIVKDCSIDNVEVTMNTANCNVTNLGIGMSRNCEEDIIMDISSQFINNLKNQI